MESTNQITTFQNATVQNATVQNATVQNATVQNATVQNATVQNATVQNATVQNATVQNATVQSYLRGPELFNCLNCICPNDYLVLWIAQIQILTQKVATFMNKFEQVSKIISKYFF